MTVLTNGRRRNRCNVSGPVVRNVVRETRRDQTVKRKNDRSRKRRTSKRRHMVRTHGDKLRPRPYIIFRQVAHGFVVTIFVRTVAFSFGAMITVVAVSARRRLAARRRALASTMTTLFTLLVTAAEWAWLPDGRVRFVPKKTTFE